VIVVDGVEVDRRGEEERRRRPLRIAERIL
jgi:hypothetical protein